MFSEIRITKNLTPDVLISVDTYFNANYKDIVIGEEELDAIRSIDGATPYLVEDKPLRIFHSRFGDDISLKELSSGTKSILLLMHRLKSKSATYTPSLNSMGSNAKGYALHYLADRLKSGHQLPCMFYCTDASLHVQDYDFRCCDEQGVPNYFITIITGEEID